MAKKAKAADDDVPGIYTKRKPIPLKVAGRSLTAAERKAARAAFDSMANQPPWVEWFATVGPFLGDATKGDNPDAARDAQYAQHLWEWCSEAMETDPAAAKVIRNAMELGKLCERVQIRAFEKVVRTGNRAILKSRRGGERTRILSPDQQKLARRLIAEQQAAGVNKTPACTRAAAMLKKEHGIEVSAKTLARL